VNRLDRYLFVELLGPMGFFALVFTGILWLLQSLRLIETIVANKESAFVFLEFSSLLLPNVMMFVIPLATFGAALYTLNRLYMESELVVMLMSGQSPWSLLKPLLIFSGLAMLAMYVITLYLMPISSTRLNDRKQEIRARFVNSMIVQGQFNHPAPGMTVFIRDSNTAGEMAGIFLHDARNTIRPVTYTANRAVLVNDQGTIMLVMFDGSIQETDVITQAVTSVAFDRFAFDLTPLVQTKSERVRRPREFLVHEVFFKADDVLPKSRPYSVYLAEAHEKLSLPLLVLTLPILALGGVLAGSFRRSGLSTRLTVAIGLMILVQLLAIMTKGIVAADASAWPIAYLPAALSAVLGLALVYVAASAKRRPRGAIAADDP